MSRRLRRRRTDRFESRRVHRFRPGASFFSDATDFPEFSVPRTVAVSRFYDPFVDDLTYPRAELGAVPVVDMPPFGFIEPAVRLSPVPRVVGSRPPPGACS